MRILKLVFVLLIPALFVGCSDSNDTQETKPTTLQRIQTGDSDATSTTAWPETDEVDASAQTLTVSLDYAPASAGNAPLTRCLAPLAPDTELGTAICGDGSTAPVMAKNVKQTCAETGEETAASEAINAGCDAYTVNVHSFEPAVMFGAE